MASEELLTNRQIVRLAAAISTSDMETVALGYLDLDEAVLKSLKTEKRDDPEGFNREVLRRWSNMNHGQVKVGFFQNVMLLTECRGFKWWGR